jgi:integrase
VGRPRLDIGTYGRITTRELKPGLFESRARFRLRNGRIKPVKRRAASKSAAERALKAAMATLADETAGKHITGDTRIGHVMDLWLAAFAEKVEQGKRAPKSLYDYRDTVNNYLRPELGELACREAENPGLVDETLKAIRGKAAKVAKRGKNGTAAMLRARTVLSGVCGYAVRHGAMKVNPVKGIEQIDHDREPVRALEPAQRGDFLAKLREFAAGKAEGPELGPRARAWTDLPDLAEAMLATGCRIGEVLALTADDVDPTAKTVSLGHHLVRVAKVGMVRQPLRKGGGAGLKPGVPSWSLPMWRRRKLESGGGPLWPSWNGQWLDPSNVGKRLSKACDAIGYSWVSSRMFRHTVATHLVDSGLTNEDAADALGNTPDVVQSSYRRRQLSNPRVGAALEDLMGG